MEFHIVISTSEPKPIGASLVGMVEIWCIDVGKSDKLRIRGAHFLDSFKLVGWHTDFDALKFACQLVVLLLIITTYMYSDVCPMVQ